MNDVSGQTTMKSSAQRAIRKQVTELYPVLEPFLEELLPSKKAGLTEAKCPDHVTVVLVNSEPRFFKTRDGPWMPTLRILHQFPTCMPHLQVDRGAIKHALRGADMMCPGFNSAGGKVDVEVAKGVPVAIHAEGKEVAMAIGLTMMSSAEIRATEKGNAVAMMHYLNDGLWQLPTFD